MTTLSFKFKITILLISAGIGGWTMDAGNTAKLDEYFLNALDPARMPRSYAEALRKNDRKLAMKTAIRYFRDRPVNLFFSDLKMRKFSQKTAEDAARGNITVINIPHQFPDGKIDFLHDPTRSSGVYNPEWQWQMNRMYFWNDMALAYLKSGNEDLASAFARQVRTWVTSVPCPEKWHRAGSAWRTIETGLRLMGSWETAFEIFRKSPSVPDETLALMLASMHEQALHALNHRTKQNWLLMELSGAYIFAVLFPEFRSSADLRKQSAEYFCREMKNQLLPDGMHNELSPDYHSVFWGCGFSFYRIASLNGYQKELPPDFSSYLERASEAYLNLMTPGFTMPRTNDCFTIDIQPRLKKSYEIFPNRQDFLWGATSGKKGSPPQGETASRFLPWAGFVAMRSGWDSNAAYLCFDVGPLGMAHVHQDKLNINIYKGNEELLFDDGGGQYENSPFRIYGTSGADHNTILVDGDGQNRELPQKTNQPIDAGFVSNEKFDYARGIYEDTFGAKPTASASHKREILFVKPDFFVVADTLKSRDGKAHDYTMLMQMDTRKVKTSPGVVHGVLNGKYDLYALLLTKNISVKVESGEKSPVSGWYVGRNDKNLHKASTVKVTAEKQKNFRFLTIYFPLKKGSEIPKAKQISETKWEIRFNGKSHRLDLQDLSACVHIADRSSAIFQVKPEASKMVLICKNKLSASKSQNF